MWIEAILQQPQRSSMMRWVGGFGAPGLFVYAFLDSSPIPLPGGAVDILTIILAARHQEWWGLYPIMGALGSTIGAYLTYLVAASRRAGTLLEKLAHARHSSLIRSVSQHGWQAIFVGVMLPPPFPLTMMLLAAGAARIPRGSFLAAVATGRLIRLSIAAWLGYRYGRSIVRHVRLLTPSAAHVAAAIAILAAVGVAFWFLWRMFHRHTPSAHAA